MGKAIWVVATLAAVTKAVRRVNRFGELFKALEQATNRWLWHREFSERDRANETSVTDLLEPTSLDTTVPEPLKFSVSEPTRLLIDKSED